MIDLHEPGEAKRLSDQIKSEIDQYCQHTYDDGFRSHLGASLIGHDCARYLWLNFRWAFHVKHSGRLYRLFNRGHREEPRFVEWLRGIGFEVIEVDTSGKQLRMAGVAGHFGGSQDGQLVPPARYQIKQPFLLAEFKTSGTGSKFTKVLEKGVAVGKPQHFDQMCMYGFARNYEFALYMMINKNDDDLHVEIVKLDHKRGADLLRKAQMVIMSPHPPARVSMNRTHHVCKFCDLEAVCWGDVPMHVNCRSCKHAVPTENAEWGCNLHKALIPKDFIAKGCINHAPIA